MPRLVVKKINEVVIQVLCDSGTIRNDLKETFSYFKPNYQHMPKFKMGLWDGRLSLYNMRNQTTYLGLLPKVIDFAKMNNCEIEIDPVLLQKSKELNYAEFLASLESKYDLYDYQEKVLEIASKEQKALFISATGSGKSLAIYALIRMINKPTLLIVPNLQLVGQMYGDFEDYSEQDPNFNAEDQIQQIHGGQTKDVHKPIVISTWQSIYNLPVEYFSQFKLVIADEAHEDKADKLRELIEKCTASEYRYGFTGTLDDNLTNETILRGLFGDTHKVSDTFDLMERGILAQLTIKQVILQYSDPTKKTRTNKDKKTKKENKFYQAETEFLLGSQARMDFINKLALRCPGNTLILFQRVEEHGEKIFEQLKKKAQEQNLDRQIFLITGKVSKDERLRIVNVAEHNTGVIIVASLGTFARGINIKNLENLIFAFGLKAKITTLQAIGRALRIGRSNKAMVFDICDDLSWKSWINHSLRHGMERLKLYQKERFNYSMIKVNLDA